MKDETKRGRGGATNGHEWMRGRRGCERVAGAWRAQVVVFAGVEVLGVEKTMPEPCPKRAPSVPEECPENAGRMTRGCPERARNGGMKDEGWRMNAERDEVPPRSSGGGLGAREGRRANREAT